MSDTQLLYGAPVAATLNEKSAALGRELAAHGVVPRLALLRVGESAGDLSYERSISHHCRELGIDVQCHALDADTSVTALLDCVARLNDDESVHAILPLLPLPSHLDSERLRRAIAPDKDVDGVTDGSLGGVMTDGAHGFAPCTAQAVIELLHHYHIDMAGRNAVVLGRSVVVGKPTALLLLREDATVTLCHSRTRDGATLCRRADILVTAIGKAGCIGRDFLAAGQVIVDAGTSTGEDGQLCGDVDFDAANGLAAAVTPVPGGLGAVTTAVLTEHIMLAAARSRL